MRKVENLQFQSLYMSDDVQVLDYVRCFNSGVTLGESVYIGKS